MRGKCGGPLLPSSGGEDDGSGVLTVPFYTVAPEARGEVANERFSSCPLALTHPDQVPAIAQVFRLYRRIHRHEGRLLGDISGLSAQIIDAVDVLDVVISEIREAERERLRGDQ